VGSAVLLGLLAVYVITPIGWDQSVSIASARLADDLGEFPQNVVRSWLSRGFGYKVYVYGLHRAASVFADYDDKQRYEIAIRSVAATVVLALLSAAVLSCRRFLLAHGICRFEAFFVLCAAHLGLSHLAAFQPEDLAALLTLLGAALVLSQRISIKVLGGVVLALTASLKGVTLLVGLSCLPAVLALCYRKGARNCVVTVSLAFLGALGVLGAIAVVWFPSEIRDLWEMAMYQRSFEISVLRRMKQMAGMLASWPHVPILAVGGPASAAVVIVLASKRKTRFLLLYLIAWLLAFLGPLAQGKGFGSHAAALIPLLAGSVLSVAVVLARNRGLRRFAVVPLLLVAASALPGMLGQPMGRFQRPSSFLQRIDEVAVDRREFQSMESRFGLSAEPRLLYLDWGITAYYWGTPSHLRHFIPLPLQRDNPAIRDTDQYRRALSEALQYGGRYVALNLTWFPLGRPDLADLKRKLEREYVAVGETYSSGPVRGTPTSRVRLLIRKPPE
jgi:hypothetical protein